MLDRGHAPAQPLARPVAARRGEAAGEAAGQDAPVGEAGLRERVMERGQLLAALARVKRHGGSRKGPRPSRRTAMGSGPGARRIRRWRTPSGSWGRATAGGWTGIWSSSSTGATTTR
jgi:hypothetical protein